MVGVSSPFQRISPAVVENSIVPLSDGTMKFASRTSCVVMTDHAPSLNRRSPELLTMKGSLVSVKKSVALRAAKPRSCWVPEVGGASCSCVPSQYANALSVANQTLLGPRA